MIVTTEMIMALKPCPGWPIRRVRAILGDGKTPLEICNDEHIPVKDRVWALRRLPNLFEINFINRFHKNCEDRANRFAAARAAAGLAPAWIYPSDRAEFESERQIQLSEIRSELIRINNKEV